MREHSGEGGIARGPTRVVASAQTSDHASPASEDVVSRPRAWQIVAMSIAALLLAIVVAGVVTIFENNRVLDITERALSFDIEVEDETSDVQVAILNLRHIHRDIVYNGSSASSIADFDDAYRALQEELGELDHLELNAIGINQPGRIREVAERYYADFRAAITANGNDLRALQTASEVGLTRLETMGDDAGQIDNLGDSLADSSLARIRAALRTEQLMITGLVLGTLLVGVALAFAGGRVLSRLRSLFELEQAGRREASKTLRSKTDFVADASHELRTPLAIILGNAETALASGDSELYQSSLIAIASEAKRMSKLVDDLLFLARSDSGRPPLEPEFLPARWLATRLVKPAEMLAQQHAGCLTAKIGGEGYLDVDPARIEQAVLALVDNAARYGPPDVCVELASYVDNGAFAIAVSDRGAGISPEELPLIFDRFYQVKNRRTRKWGASGLGLPIARSIVAAHGGSISSESSLGEGTTMTIRLPMASPPEASDEPSL